MKRNYPVYTIIAILLMVFTFNPVAYASYYNDNGDDYRYDQDYRDYRYDRAEFHGAAEAVLLLATVADLVGNNNHYYNRGPRFHQYQPWSYRNAHYYHHRPVYRYNQHNRWHR